MKLRDLLRKPVNLSFYDNPATISLLAEITCLISSKHNPRLDPEEKLFLQELLNEASAAMQGKLKELPEAFKPDKYARTLIPFELATIVSFVRSIK